VEVISGPQSAIYGPLRHSGAINFVNAPRRFRRPPSTSWRRRQQLRAPLRHLGRRPAGWFRDSGFRVASGHGWSRHQQRLSQRKPAAERHAHFHRQMLALHGDFDSNQVGEPGPWGSDPKHTFTGIDTISRSRNNFSHYLAHYQADIWGRVREELFGTFFPEQQTGTKSALRIRFQPRPPRGRARRAPIISVTRHYTAAVGVQRWAWRRSRQLHHGRRLPDISHPPAATPQVYLENRWELGGRLFLNAGVRGEFIHTAFHPSGRISRGRFFPRRRPFRRPIPKLAAAYVLGRTRWHSSFGTGNPAAAGFDLAYTNNPALKPERTRRLRRRRGAETFPCPPGAGRDVLL